MAVKDDVDRIAKMMQEEMDQKILQEKKQQLDAANNPRARERDYNHRDTDRYHDGRRDGSDRYDDGRRGRDDRYDDGRRGRDDRDDGYRARDRDDRDDGYRVRDRDDRGDGYRARDRSPGHRPPPLDPAPVLFKVYDGFVTGIKDFGVFVRLEGVQRIGGRGGEGMVHISNLIANQRVGHPSDIVARGDKVKVKVMSMENNRVGLSMKDVDQHTGRDLNPQSATSGSFRNPDRPQESLTGINLSSSNLSAPVKKRFTSPERFEIKQLIASGVLDPKDYPDFDEEVGLLHVEDEEQDLDVEIKEVFI